MENRKQAERINELFQRLQLQLTQDREIEKWNKKGYINIKEMSDELKCPEEILLINIDSFGDVQTFQQHNGQPYILLHKDTVQEWFNKEKNEAKEEKQNIHQYLYLKYLNIDFSNCIPLGAAKDFSNQSNIPDNIFIEAVENNELQIVKFEDEEMLNEEELSHWIKNYHGDSLPNEE